MDEQFLYTFGLVKATSYALLKSRGYTVRDAMDPMAEISRLYTLAKANKLSLAEAATEDIPDATKPLKIIFLDRNYDPMKRKDKMISTDQIKSIQGLPDPKLIIVPTKLSPQAKKEATSLKIFLFDQLLFTLPNHIYYLPHEKVPSKEGQEEFPQILESDPVVQWYGWPKGSLIKISRPDGPMFRVVV